MTETANKRLPAANMLRGAGVDQWTVAHKAKVSQATVSEVLNGHIQNERVLDTVRKLLPGHDDEALFGTDKTS